jgi:hypothetical protein
MRDTDNICNRKFTLELNCVFEKSLMRDYSFDDGMPGINPEN